MHQTVITKEAFLIAEMCCGTAWPLAVEVRQLTSLYVFKIKKP